MKEAWGRSFCFLKYDIPVTPVTSYLPQGENISVEPPDRLAKHMGLLIMTRKNRW